MKKPAISIITCTMNSSKYLENNLRSVEKQKFRDFEHIFIDGFSRDKTISIIQAYKKRNPDIEVKIIKSKPRGVSNAMNLGIKRARGELIHFLHSDDYYYNNNVLGEVNKQFHNKNIVFLVGNHIELNKNKITIVKNNFYKKQLRKYLIYLGNCISHPSTFMKKQVFIKYGLFDESFKIAMDYEYWLRIYRNVKPYFVNKNFVVFRVHNLGLSSNQKNKALIKKEEERAFNKHQGNKFLIFLRSFIISKVY